MLNFINGIFNKKLLLLLCLIFFLFYNCESVPDLPERGVCAHRGANETHPENTLTAFKEAIRLGAHMIEFDVRKTKDDELIIIHDKTVDRTTNGKGKVADLTLSELKIMDAGAWKHLKFTGEKTPTLSETLDIMPKNIWLNVHIKGGAEVGKKTAELIIKKNRLHQAVLACKTEAALAAREVDIRIKICNMERLNNSDEYVNETITQKADFIQLKERADEMLPELTQKLKKNNIRINYYGTNSSEKLKQLFADGVDFPLVDNLEQMLKAAKEMGIQPVKPGY
ncbi:MAG: hypothetical protein K8R68_08730 [Bacteroidales bacterium]|nr:hypothetical protein [Bacteroidales bacterium]